VRSCYYHPLFTRTERRKEGVEEELGGRAELGGLGGDSWWKGAVWDRGRPEQS